MRASNKGSSSGPAMSDISSTYLDDLSVYMDTGGRRRHRLRIADHTAWLTPPIRPHRVGRRCRLSRLQSFRMWPSHSRWTRKGYRFEAADWPRRRPLTSPCCRICVAPAWARCRWVVKIRRGRVSKRVLERCNNSLAAMVAQVEVSREAQEVADRVAAKSPPSRGAHSKGDGSPPVRVGQSPSYFEADTGSRVSSPSRQLRSSRDTANRERTRSPVQGLPIHVQSKVALRRCLPICWLRSLRGWLARSSTRPRRRHRRIRLNGWRRVDEVASETHSVSRMPSTEGQSIIRRTSNIRHALGAVLPPRHLTRLTVAPRGRGGTRFPPCTAILRSHLSHASRTSSHGR